ncbi:MAG: High-affinity branched-chain amino acid transport system permease protein LivH, partial [uncultured Rubrobacteraceae bacterium]
GHHRSTFTPHDRGAPAHRRRHPRLPVEVGPVRGSRRAARLLRDQGPHRRGRPLPLGPEHLPGALQRLHLGVDRRGLHARLRHHRAHQLRPRRRLHARLVRLGRPVRHARPDARDGSRRALRRPAGHADHRDDRVRLAQRDDREGGLPAAAQRAQARAAHHRGRLLLHPAERRPPLGGRLAQLGRRPHPGPAGGRHDRRRRRPARGPARDPGDDPARARDDHLHQHVAARQGHARHRAGPRRRAPAGHQRRHDDLDDLPDRRHARRRGGPHLRPVPDDDLVLPGLPGRPHRLHRGGHGRHRQPQGRRPRRPHHRRHPADLGQPDRHGVDPGDRVRLPHPDHGLPAAGAHRRADEGGGL